MLQFICFIFYFLAASISPLQRRWLAVKRTNESIGQINFAFKVTLIMAILSLLIPFFQPFKVMGDPVKIVILTLLCGLSGATFYIFYYSSQKYVDAGIGAIVNNIYTPITIILATVFLNEKLTLIQIFGTVLLLFSIVLISKKHRIGKIRFDKYFLMALGAGMVLGVLLTSERALQKTTGFTAGTIFSWWSFCTILGILSFLTHGKTLHTTKDILITSILRFLQGLSWVTLVFVVGNLSIVSAITTFKIVGVFIGAAIFLKERDDLPRKIIGSIIAIIGLLLMK